MFREVQVARCLLQRWKFPSKIVAGCHACSLSWLLQDVMLVAESIFVEFCGTIDIDIIPIVVLALGGGWS